MTLYAIANYKMQMTLVSIDIYYDPETANKVHNELKKKDPDNEHWLHYMENEEGIKDIPLVRKERP